MIQKYISGSFLETDAVVMQLPVNGPVQNNTVFRIDGDGQELIYEMNPSEIVYGLGENLRGMNKRGWRYVSNCTDDPNHTEDKVSLYASHNFLLLYKPECPEDAIGVFLDTGGEVEFDIGCEMINRLLIRIPGGNYVLYLIRGSSLQEIVRQFRELIGPSYTPPEWAFGYGQSRWGYKTAEDIREVADQYEKQKIPLDMIYLDIDYMVGYKDFTVDENKFPDFPAFVQEMKERGIHLIPIIDAGVKVEPGYQVYDEGIQKGYFCKKENGQVFTGAVWPGLVHFPDFLDEDARKWFGDQYKFLLDAGIEGFWNDMNEPAIFYTPEHLQEVWEELEQLREKKLEDDGYFRLFEVLGSLSNNSQDYHRFYHHYRGQTIRHDLIHNLYGTFMTRAASEAFARLVPDRNILLFSRASSIGMHRYGGLWTGDNQSWWSHLLLNIQMMPALNMCGFLYSGADLGGFGSHSTPDLMMRWLEFGVFTPLMRNHSALGTRQQELYRFEQIEDFRNLILLRHRLIPYISRSFHQAVEENGMYFRPLSFDYPGDLRAARIDDQLMVGDKLMIAPIYRQNAAGRYVYLPEDMKMYRYRSLEDYDEQKLPQGDHYLDVALNEVLIFVRA